MQSSECENELKWKFFLSFFVGSCCRFFILLLSALIVFLSTYLLRGPFGSWLWCVGVRKFVVQASGSREILTTWLKIYYYTRHAAKGPDQLVYFRTEIALWQSGFTIPSPPTPTEPLDNRATASAPPTYRHLSTHFPHTCWASWPEEDIRCSDDLTKSVWRFVETRWEISADFMDLRVVS